MAIINAPPPLGDPVANPKRPEYRNSADPLEGLVSQRWGDWFGQLVTLLERQSSRLAKVSLTSQAASISTTEIPSGALTAGLYQIKYYLRLQAVDSVSASVVLTLTFTWNGDTRTITSGTLGANTLAQTVSASPLIRVDNNTQVSYSTTAAFGTGDGLYALDITFDEVAA